jgi:antitoxin ParD1/3/4
MRVSLRLLEEQELKIDALRAAIIQGEESGQPSAFAMNAFIAKIVTHSNQDNLPYATGAG